MRKILLFVALLSGSFGSAWSQTAPPADLEKEALRTWLKQNWYTTYYNNLGYDAARRAMYSYIDVQQDGRVYCVYSGFSQPSRSTTYLNPINTEHTVPQSFFGSAEPMRSDLFHLYPTHEEVNETRSNYPFDEISDLQTDTWHSVNSQNQYTIVTAKPAVQKDAYSEFDPYRFEPREDHKGDVARAVLYFYTMYPTEAGAISRVVGAKGMETLYMWHLQDPVSDWERQRNARVKETQGNQNPYIVYPELVCRAWGFNCSQSSSMFIADGASLKTFPTTQQGAVSAPQAYHFRWYDVQGGIIINATADFQLSFEKNGNYYGKLQLTETTGDTLVYVKFAPQAAYDGIVNGTLLHKSGTQEASIAVSGLEGDPALLPYAMLLENFTGCTQQVRGWLRYSSASNKDWNCVDADYDGKAISINGFGGDAPSRDWLISPRIDLKQYKNVSLSFQAWTRYAGPEIKVLYSTNYTGSGDPADPAVGWQPLSVSLPAQDTKLWQEEAMPLPDTAGS